MIKIGSTYKENLAKVVGYILSNDIEKGEIAVITRSKYKNRCYAGCNLTEPPDTRLEIINRSKRRIPRFYIHYSCCLERIIS